MPMITESAEIELDPDTLWKEIGDFGAVVRWHPMLNGLIVDETGDERIRIANPGSQNEQVERLESADSASHWYRYTIERTNMPVRDYVGELRIEPLPGNGSRVIWSARFELTGEGDGRTVETVRHFLHEGTTHLRDEYGSPPSGEPQGVENRIADADKAARTGTRTEPVRNAPPAGAWNDTSAD
jgi:mxaD protein